METHTKDKKQRQKVYNAQHVVAHTNNILPALSKYKDKEIYKSLPNKDHMFVVDSSGLIIGTSGKWRQSSKRFQLKINDWLVETPEDSRYAITSDDFVGMKQWADDWNDTVNHSKHEFKMVKNPDYIGYEATNKLVNKIVKEKIYNTAFYKKYFKPIRIDCKGNAGPAWFKHTYPPHIVLKTWCGDRTLLHELAHQFGDDHDSRFATAYLMLVGRYLGHKEQIQLMDSFRENGVEWNGAFSHSKTCYIQNGYPEKAGKNKGQCTTGKTKMNNGWKDLHLY